MTEGQRRAAAKQFAQDWQGRGYEKGESQPFWLSLLQRVYGVEEPEKFISFEEKVVLDHTSFIDGFIPSTHVLIEQKGLGKDLNAAIKQSDGSFLSPFQQAKRYAAELPYSQRPRWIVTCNFAGFYVYDMERPTGEPEIIRLCDLEKEYYRLQFLVDTGDSSIQREMEISLQAGELVGLLYDALLRQYKDPGNLESLKSLNALCVRLVFCLYAEDAGIFGRHGMFHNYLERHRAEDRLALIRLFRVLDQRPEGRDPYLEDDLAAFPYVNGGLFADESIEIPRLGGEVIDLILRQASEGFDWSEISPTIFGAVFESTLNPETRRSGGMHYTSIENIHKVIDPLFLDELKAELAQIKETAVEKIRFARLRAFQKKLSGLTFLDPACGSGNFLTETYISLRRLENEAIALLNRGQVAFGEGEHTPIEVSIGQFYGIEINDFAVTVARTALWIAESQMMKETEDVVHMALEFLPLKTTAHITGGNALRLDWESVVPKQELHYIMGNPPFIGGMMMDREQKTDIINLLGSAKGVGELDYVAGWYKKAVDYMKGTRIVTAFVSTNSICQGQQAVTMWKPIFEAGAKIHFAYRTFIWDSEAKAKAHVHCVIVGFSHENAQVKMLYDGEIRKAAANINSYLMDAPSVFVTSRSKPLAAVPAMRFGSMPRDGGGFILTDEERAELIKKEPLAEKWIHPYIGAYEFINNKSRWCLWLVDASPAELKKCPIVMKRVQQIQEFRANSVASGTRKFAATPTLFCQIAQPDTEYIVVPKVSSERRKYVPMGFLPPEVIASDLVFLIPNAVLYHFGVLTSNVHMAWMRAVCGRLKSDYRYSKDIVYNNFPWPTPTEEQKKKIEQTAQGILDARALYPDCSLADLYDELTMPSELRRAHQQNDRAVMAAYGFPVKGTTESSCVAELMRRYQALAER